MAAIEENPDMTLPRFLQIITHRGGKSAGAIRVSLGVASNVADVSRFVQFAAGLRDQTRLALGEDLRHRIMPRNSRRELSPRPSHASATFARNLSYSVPVRQKSRRRCPMRWIARLGMEVFRRLSERGGNRLKGRRD
jgi:hypothetical protein